MTPNIWYVVYFDPDAPFKRAEVKFGAGRQMGVKRESHPFGGSGSLDKVLDLKKFKIDSDRAIKTATAEPLLAKLTLKATQPRTSGRSSSRPRAAKSLRATCTSIKWIDSAPLVRPASMTESVATRWETESFAGDGGTSAAR